MRSPQGPLALLATPGFRRLWVAGGVGNSMRWLDLLVAGLYTYGLTGSTVLVAVVAIARTLPMLLLGAVAGAVAEAVSRKHILLTGLCLIAISSGTLGLLALAGVLEIWQLVVAGFFNGSVWATEMSVRRRMIGEVVPETQVAGAIAFDSLTNSFARMAGPMLGGIVYQAVGVAGAYFLSSLLHLTAAAVVAGLVFSQARRPLSIRRIPAEIADGLAIARRHPVILTVLCVSIITNMFGFSYGTLVAPIGIEKFAATPILIGVLAAAEPLGAMVSGLALSTGWFGGDHPRMFMRGSFVFMAGLAVMALSPWYGLGFAALFVGGLGTARYSIMQTTLVLSRVPPETRSRVMGIVTMCIGTGPFGALLIGTLSDRLGPVAALLISAALGAGLLALVRLRLGPLQA